MGAHTDNIPIYRKIQEEIVSDILAGIYPVGSCIRGQEYYAKRYSISRTTVRIAIDELIDRGLLYTIKGKGTYVKSRMAFLSVASGSSNTVERQSYPYFKLQQLRVIKAEARIAKRLGVVIGTPVLCIVRVKYINNAPSNHQSSYLNPELVHDVDFATEDLETGSLYNLLIHKAGLKPEYSDEIIRAVECPRWVAEHFDIKASAPVLYITRTTYSESGLVMEYCEDYECTTVAGLHRRNGIGKETDCK